MFLGEEIFYQSCTSSLYSDMPLSFFGWGRNSSKGPRKVECFQIRYQKQPLQMSNTKIVPLRSTFLNIFNLGWYQTKFWFINNQFAIKVPKRHSSSSLNCFLDRAKTFKSDLKYSSHWKTILSDIFNIG